MARKLTRRAAESHFNENRIWLPTGHLAFCGLTSKVPSRHNHLEEPVSSSVPPVLDVMFELPRRRVLPEPPAVRRHAGHLTRYRLRHMTRDTASGYLLLHHDWRRLVDPADDSTGRGTSPKRLQLHDYLKPFCTDGARVF